MSFKANKIYQSSLVNLDIIKSTCIDSSIIFNYSKITELMLLCEFPINQK